MIEKIKVKIPTKLGFIELEGTPEQVTIAIKKIEEEQFPKNDFLPK